MKIKHILCILSLLGLLGSSAYAQTTWDLAGDWNSPANPNGAWTYGEFNGGVFVPLSWTGSWYGDTSGGFVYKNTSGSAAFGIDPGQVSIESDYGSAAVRWTAPTAGDYNIAVFIGGTTASEGGGFGNNFVSDAGLNINGVSQAFSAFSDNVMSWTISDVFLNAGATVDAYVMNPGYALGGNTETLFSITEVPEPATYALLGLGAIGFIRRRKNA